MEFGLKDVLYIIGIVVSAVISFLSTRHKMKDHVRDNHDILKDDINQLKLQLTELKSKDDLQQQVIEQIGKQIDNLIPMLVNAINKKKQSDEVN